MKEIQFNNKGRSNNLIDDRLLSVLKDLKGEIDQRLLEQVNLEDELSRATEVIDDIQTSLRPILKISLETMIDSKGIGIYIHNAGAGNAYIKEFSARYKDVPINELYHERKGVLDFWGILFNEMKLKKVHFWTNSMLVHSDFGHLKKIASGEVTYLLRLNQRHAKHDRGIEFLECLRHLTLEIQYNSSINNSYVVTRNNWTPMGISKPKD